MITAGLSMGLGEVASASDLPVRSISKAPVVVAPVYSWTGCYLGGNIGAAWENADFAGPGRAGASASNVGFAGGVQGGCDYQAGAFVVGIRNLIDWSSLTSNATFNGAPLSNYTASSTSNWFDALTARAGYTVQPSWLFYAQGGVAWMSSNRYVNTPVQVQIAQFGNTLTGWTVGGGTEYMLSPNWSVFAEYNYFNFGTNSGTVPGIGRVNATIQSQNVLLGFNYRFAIR